MTKLQKKIAALEFRLRLLEGDVAKLINTKQDQPATPCNDGVEVRYVIRAVVSGGPGTKSLSAFAYYVGELYNLVTGYTNSLWVQGDFEDGEIHDVAAWESVEVLQGTLEDKEIALTRPTSLYRRFEIVCQKRTPDDGETTGW